MRGPLSGPLSDPLRAPREFLGASPGISITIYYLYLISNILVLRLSNNLLGPLYCELFQLYRSIRIVL